MLILFDTAHAKLCALDNYSDLYVEQAVGSSTTPIATDQLHFKYALEDGHNKLIDYECYIGTEDAEYIVKEINLQTTEGSTGGPTWIEYVCDLNVEPLKGTLINKFAPGSVTADSAANLALAGTGWAVGYCDVTKRRTAVGINCTVWDALGDVAKAYSCDIMFDAVNKLVNIYQKQGTSRGAYFSEQLNLKQLQIQGNSRDYITRLYPIGKDGMSIASVNGGVKYVSNYQYSTKIVSAYWIDNRYTVAQDMYDDAVERLDYMSKPTRAYSASIVDLARVSNKWDLLDFALGDSITLLSESTGVREQQRIVKIDRYLDEPEKSTCEVSNKIASLDDIVLRVSDAADTVEDATDSTGAIQGNNVQVTNPDGTYSSVNAAVANIGSLIATKATITDLTAQTARIDNLVATSVTTDYLKANYITADSIKASYATIGNLDAATARITTLESSQLTTDYLKANYADINLANIAAGTIKTAMIDTGAIGTAQIADGSITDAKITELTADKITAGTLSVDRLIITGSDKSIVYTINEVNGTAQLSQTTIDGGSLTQRSITADRIVAGAITAKEIASKTITADNILAGTITGAEIKAGSITADNIKSGSITADKLDTADLTASKFASTDPSGMHAIIDTLSQSGTETDHGPYVETTNALTMLDSSNTKQIAMGVNQWVYTEGSSFNGTESFINYNGSLTISNNLSTSNTGKTYISLADDLILLSTPVSWMRCDSSGFNVMSNAGSNTSFKIVPLSDSSLLINNAINGHGSIYLCSNDGVQVTNPAHNSYVGIYASGFHNASSVDFKQDIALYAGNATSIIKSSDIYQFRYKSELESDNLSYGFVIGDGYATPSEVLSADKKSVNLYSMSAIEWAAIQRLQTQVAALEAKTA